MMRYLFTIAVTGVSAIALAATPALAQSDASGPETKDGLAGVASGDIIVTARRKSEVIEDVPQTVNVVTGDQLEKLALNQLSDIGKVVAGLQIDGANVSMRGITFGLTAGTGNTVATYLNEAPVLSSTLFRATFDVGQIEVLRGPQGTARGLAAPSGAITLNTRRPDLTQAGGYINGQINNHHGGNVQGALNIPIIHDVLSVRVAGLLDRTDAGGVRSVNTARRPFLETRGGRVSVRFEPNDAIAINAAYHRLHIEGENYGDAVFGTGSPGVAGNPNAPAGYNGPVLNIGDDRAVQAFANPTDDNIEIWTINGDWRFKGQRLSTVLSWQELRTGTVGSADVGNMLLGFPFRNSNVKSRDVIATQEVRLASDERIAGIFDYVVGFFHRTDNVDVLGTFSPRFLPGAFGAPGSIPNPKTAPDLRYVSAQLISNPSNLKETSFFGNLTAHIGQRFEVSGGVRHIDFEQVRGTTITIPEALTSVASPPVAFGGCAAIPANAAQGTSAGRASSTYPGACDITVFARTIPFVIAPAKVKSWVWDAAVSYKITPDLMVYGHAGSSWRQPFAGVGIGSTSRLASQLTGNIAGNPETSKGWEVGAKWTFLGGRGHLFVDYFQQKFDGLIVQSSAFYITSDPVAGGSSGTGSSFTFTNNVPAKITGVDVELGFNLTDRWSILVNYSRAKGKIQSNIPCTDTNFDGVADVAPASNSPAQAAYIAALLARNTIYATCAPVVGTSTAPDWNLRAQSEFTVPVSRIGDAFLRATFQYQPENRNASQTFVTPAYGLLDLFLGLRDPKGGWEVSVFGRNIFNTNKLLSNVDTSLVPAIGGPQGAPFGTSGYRTYTRTPRREFGLAARFAFGSR